MRGNPASARFWGGIHIVEVACIPFQHSQRPGVNGANPDSWPARTSGWTCYNLSLVFYGRYFRIGVLAFSYTVGVFSDKPTRYYQKEQASLKPASSEISLSDLQHMDTLVLLSKKTIRFTAHCVSRESALDFE